MWHVRTVHGFDRRVSCTDVVLGETSGGFGPWGNGIRELLKGCRRRPWDWIGYLRVCDRNEQSPGASPEVLLIRPSEYNPRYRRS